MDGKHGTLIIFAHARLLIYPIQLKQQLVFTIPIFNRFLLKKI